MRIIQNNAMLFQPVRRPSGFTQSAMRYPPRSPDITINTQAKTRNVFAACAEPTLDNQYTTFKPTHELVHAAMRNHLLIEFEPSHLNRHLTQNGKWLL